jgi:8-oxo-dGTP diphosphatase
VARREGVVAVIHRGGRILFIKRAEGTPHPGVWAPPSGEIDPGESQEATLVREVREEVDLEVRPLRCVRQSVSASGTHTLYWWLAEPVGETLTLDASEASEARWVTAAEFAVLSPTFPGDCDFFNGIWPKEADAMTARTPADCDRLFAEHVNAGDLDALVTLYEPECSLVQSDGGVAKGHAAIREVMQRLLAMRPAMRTEVTKVVQTGEDLAIVYNDWNLAAKRPDGTPIERAGKALEVVRRQPDGTWKFAIDDPFGRG